MSTRSQGMLVSLAWLSLVGTADAQLREHGYVNRLGKVEIAPAYEVAFGFRHGVAVVGNLGLHGLIDIDGEWVVLPAYKKIAAPPEGASLFGTLCDTCVWVALDSTGATIREYAIPADGYGKVEVLGFTGGFARIRWSRTTGWVDETGKLLRLADTLSLPSDFGEGLIAVRNSKTERIGFMNGAGSVVIPLALDLDWAEPFANGRAVVKRNNVYGVIDRKGRVIVKPKYEDISSFSEGIAIAMAEDGKSFIYIDTTGRQAVPGKFSKAFPFAEGVATVTLGYDTALIDRKGKVLWRRRGMDGVILGDSVVATELDNMTRSSLVDFSGAVLSDSVPGRMTGPFQEGLAPFIRQSAEALRRSAERDRQYYEKRRLERQQRIAAANAPQPPSVSTGPAPGKARYVYYVVKQSMKTTMREMTSGGVKYKLSSVSWYVDYGFIDAPTGTSPGSLGNLFEGRHRSLTIKAGEGVFLLEAGMSATEEAMRLSGVRKKESDFLWTWFLGTVVK